MEHWNFHLHDTGWKRYNLYTINFLFAIPSSNYAKLGLGLFCEPVNISLHFLNPQHSPMFPMDPQTLSWSDNTTLSLSIIKLEQSVASIPSQNNVFFSNFPTALITGWMSWGRKYFNFFPTLEAVKYLWISGTSYNLLFKCLRYLSRRNFKWLNLMGRTFTQLNEAKAVLKLIHGFSTWVVMLTLYNYVSMMIKNFDDLTVNIDEKIHLVSILITFHVSLLQDWTVTTL